MMILLLVHLYNFLDILMFLIILMFLKANVALKFNNSKIALCFKYEFSTYLFMNIKI